jgi:beta-glucosidase
MQIIQRFFIVLLMLMEFFIAAAQAPAYKNKNLSPQQRAADLIKRMTVDEKLAQMQCVWGGKTNFLDSNGNFDEAKAAIFLKNGIGEIARINEVFGTQTKGRHPKDAVALYNKVQKFFIEKTRLGIPVMVHEESLHGQQTQDATNFPIPISLASTWDENLMMEIYTAVAKEVRSRGAQHVLAPVIDVVRDPRWGRTEETLGEDPYLISKLATAQIKAYQGTGEYLAKDKVGVTLKHFGVHGQSEGGVNVSPSNIDERAAMEIFFAPFHYCIKEAKPMNIMPCYNEVFGLPVHANKNLLTGLLRNQWGFKGVMVSDYGAVDDLHTLHKIAADKKTAGLLAFKAGVDIETADASGFLFLKELYNEKKITMAEIDEHVVRILINKFRAGLFDNPYCDEEYAEAVTGSEAHRKIAYNAAGKGMVLLQNKNNFLPLDETNVKTVAVIGPNADKALLGGYSGQPRMSISPLQALKEKYGSNISFIYSEGVQLTNVNDWFGDTVYLVKNSEEKIKEAVAVAMQADVVLLFVGGNESMQREAWAKNHTGDLPTLELLNGQIELINAIAATGKPVTAFVNSGPPLNLSPLLDKANSVMQCWYLGQEGGYAIADAVFGKINPSGKLPISMPRGAGYLPCYYNYKPSARRGYHLGYDITPLFPFGYGLSYTTYAYGKPQISSAAMPMNGSITLSVDVTNTGNRDGDEIVQLYIRDDYSSVTRPVKELKGFERIALKTGETKNVLFTITKEELSFYDASMKWIAEPGTFTLMVGGSSDKTQDVSFKLLK